MSRKHKWIAAAIVFVSAAASYALYARYTERKAAKRQAQYESVVREYQQRFKNGTERRELEAALQAERIRFVRTSSGARSTATAIPVGEEDPPWFCNHRTVYVAFEFSGDGERDTLSNIHILKSLADCL